MKAAKAVKSVTSLLVTIAITLAGVTPATAAVTANLSIPLDLFVFVPCAAGGAGEMVELTGPLHVVMALTANQAGGFTVVAHFQPQGVSGIGFTTGLRYNATGETDETFTVNAGQTDTFVNNFKIIGQGPNNNFMVHENVHITINANGIVTASVDNLSVLCQ